MAFLQSLNHLNHDGLQKKFNVKQAPSDLENVY